MAKHKSWNDRLVAAEKRGYFTEFEKKLATLDWSTCAVGEKHHFPSRDIWYERTPDEDTLGLQFSHEVEADNLFAARRLYDKIMALPL